MSEPMLSSVTTAHASWFFSDSTHMNSNSATSPQTEMRIPFAEDQPRVLLVEDEPKLRQSLVEGLRLENLSVTGVGTAAEAEEQINGTDFDLIVLDWMLPDGNGVEMAARLRAQGKRMPVLIISARGGNATKDLVLRSGASGFLAKPFSFTDLLSQSRALLEMPM